jgi:hypothetical protein
MHAVTGSVKGHPTLEQCHRKARHGSQYCAVHEK